MLVVVVVVRRCTIFANATFYRKMSSGLNRFRNAPVSVCPRRRHYFGSRVPDQSCVRRVRDRYVPQTRRCCMGVVRTRVREILFCSVLPTTAKMCAQCNVCVVCRPHREHGNSGDFAHTHMDNRCEPNLYRLLYLATATAPARAWQLLRCCPSHIRYMLCACARDCSAARVRMCVLNDGIMCMCAKRIETPAGRTSPH